MIDYSAQPVAFVVRLITPPGAFFPRQEYLTASREWKGSQAEAERFPSDEADALAKRMTSTAAHVFPVVPESRREGVAADLADWRQGKPNCGLE